MRIKEEFKKYGYFWLPLAPEKRIPGILFIKDGGEIELEIMGLFDEEIKKHNIIELQRINGHIEEHGYITLDKCFYKNKNVSFTGGICKSSLHVNTAYIGVAYDDKEAILFNTFQFSVEGIDEWVGLSGIEISHILEKNHTSITYSPPEEISLEINNGMILGITFSWNVPLFAASIRKEAKITQKAYFKLTSKKECALDEFISASYKITNLLGFAVDKTVCIEQISVTSEAIQEDLGNGEKRPVSILLYYKSLPYTQTEPKIDQHDMLFRFNQIREDAERIVNNWFNAYDEIDPALNLYFSVKAGAHRYLDSKFLALAQALETYHRRTSNEKLMDENAFNSLVDNLIDLCPNENKEWLKGRLTYGNEVTLSRRIKSIIEPFKKIFGNCADRNKLIRSIVDTRNYLTHYDKSLESKAASGRGLISLCFKMEAIFQLHLLQALGFTNAEIESVLKNSYDLSQKLTWK